MVPEELKDKIVCVVGLGYVGLPLAEAFSRQIKTVGFDIDSMAYVIEGFRWALLGTALPSYLIAISALIVAVLLVSGAFYFKRMEKTFADVV